VATAKAKGLKVTSNTTATITTAATIRSNYWWGEQNYSLSKDLQNHRSTKIVSIC